MESVRLVIAEDDETMCRALRTILASAPQIDLLGCASGGEQALQLVMQFEPDVLLTDIQMPCLNGIAVARRVMRSIPQVRVVMWTVLGDDQTLFDAIKAGATGYLLKDSPPSNIIDGILATARGESLIHPAMAVRIVEEFNRMRETGVQQADLLMDLTARELEILKLLAQGKCNQEIADELCLSRATVRNYISSILFKLQANSRAEAARIALKRGLV